MSPLRTWLVLGRVSNLPTVWSNCLAGWWLGGGGNVGKLPLLFGGATLLYLGGMFLNDAFDEEFDRQHRRSRPIPSGAVSARTVWRCGLAWLALGSFCFVSLGTRTGILGIALLLCILAYDAIHKMVAFSPVLMGACRFFVYVIAASTATKGVTGWAIWSGLVLAAYIVGLSFLARVESTRGSPQNWPLALLAVPILLAQLMNTGIHREPALLLSIILALWIIRSLRPMLWSPERQVGRAVGHLLAGIVFVDLLAIADAPRELSCICLLFFAMALLAQRFVPAT